MARRIAAMAVVLIVVAASSTLAQQPQGATIIFGPNDILVYQGVGDSRAEEPTGEPVSVGNFVIEAVARPSESDLGDWGLTMRYRTGPYQILLNTQTWGWPQSRNGLHLRCRATDPEAPIGFRVAAEVFDRSQNQAWLYLDVGPNAWDRRPAVIANRRCRNGTHRWYVPLLLDELYPAGRDDEDQFSIVLGVGGWGAYGIRKLEIKPYLPLRAD